MQNKSNMKMKMPQKIKRTLTIFVERGIMTLIIQIPYTV